MPDDDIHSTAPSRDSPRHAATSPDQFSLTIEQAATRYEHAGHPRTIRSIQRYCAKGHLDCLRQETTFGDKYLITPDSVARHIAQIEELTSATGRDVPRLDAAGVAAPTLNAADQRPTTTAAASSRQDATGRGMSETPEPDTRYVQQLERENGFLREQISVKDAQITELGTRARETNVLIKGLQELFLALNPSRPELRIHQAEDQTASNHSQPDQPAP